MSSRRRPPQALWTRRRTPAWLAIAAACALAAAAAAQTGSAPRANAPEASATEPPLAGAEGSAPDAPTTAGTTRPAAPETERTSGPTGHFEPSEHVPAGSSVSFPVDI